MTQKEKQLLLKDICARLPYNTQGEGIYEEEVWHNGFPRNKKVVGHIEGIDHIGFDDEEIYVTIEGIQCELCDVKLYLRPMSSMTEEEEIELSELFWNSKADYQGATAISDFCYEHHLDNHDLIQMDLAFEAPDGMYSF